MATCRATCKQRWRMTLRIILNIIIKLLYFFSNVMALLALDHVLNGEYVGFGSKFLQWARLENTIQYDYMGMRDYPKPGNLLLPPFGYCEMYESSRDVKTTIANRYKFVCEVSQNILYQYCLALFWFAIFGGYIASLIGLVHLLVSYLQLWWRRDADDDKEDFGFLHLRELELLDFLRTKDLSLYEECKEILLTRHEDEQIDNVENYQL